MNNDTSNSPNPREELERKILLRSTNELPQEEAPALDALLANDAAAASFAAFLENKLLLAAKAPRDFAALAIEKAPRDFAAEAISAAAVEPPARKVVPFPLRKYAAVAAAAAAAIVLALNIWNWTHRSDLTDPTYVKATTPAPARTTLSISSRLDKMEAELTQARARMGRGRYAHSTTL